MIVIIRTLAIKHNKHKILCSQTTESKAAFTRESNKHTRASDFLKLFLAADPHNVPYLY